MKPFYLLFLLGLIYIQAFSQSQYSSLFGFGKAGSCNVNVNCSEGNEWKLQRNSIVRIYNNAESRVIGTGVLINNTSNDFTPYVLTAYHVIAYLSPDKYSTLTFYFNYQSPSCANPSDESNFNHQVIKGFKLIAYSKDDKHDYALLKLDNDIPKEWNPYFAGWTTLEDDIEEGVCIHHPHGDIKKISYVNKIESIDNENLWNVIFRKTENGYGITEQGSSGAPLFNRNGLIIGNLHGGASACGQQGESDNFNKFSNNYINEEDPSNELKMWLDPENIGIGSLSGIGHQVTSTDEKELDKTFVIYPNPCQYIVNIEFGNNKTPLNIKIYDTSGRLINALANITEESKTLDLNLSNAPRGFYIICLEYSNYKINKYIIKQ